MKFIVLFALVLNACASPPQTKEAFRAVAEKDFDQDVIDLTGTSFSDAKKRLVQFAQKCLKVNINKTSVTSNSMGPGTANAPAMSYSTASTSTTKQNISLEDTAKRAAIYLQRDFGSNNPFFSAPEGGYYVMMITVDAGKPNPVGKVLYYKSIFNPTDQDIKESAMAWIGQNIKSFVFC
jgi:hypothetical protein